MHKCPGGHQWEVTADDTLADGAGALVCPYCNAALEDPPLPKAMPAAANDLAGLRVSLTPEEAPLRVAGFEIVRELGRGGMGGGSATRVHPLDCDGFFASLGLGDVGARWLGSKHQEPGGLASWGWTEGISSSAVGRWL